MKKFFTSLTMLCAGCIIALAQSLYTTDFLTEEDFNAWTVIDANEDGATWKFESGASPSFVFYTYSGTNAADDWFISPAISAPETGSVAIAIRVQGSSYGEKLQVFKGSTATVESMTAISEVLELDGSETSHIYIVNVNENEPFHLGFKACSDADKWRLYLCSVTVQFTTNPVDMTVTEITAPESNFDLSNETVKIKVKNAGQVQVESFDVSYSVDDQAVVTETVNQPLGVGEEMEYTFTATADLSSPRHLYNIKAWTSHPDDINPNNDATTTTVLHKAPASVPYTMGFEASEYTEGITFFNLNEDEGDWNLYSDPYWSLSHSGDYCLAYNYDKNNSGNDWAILEPITISEPGYYVLKFWYSGDDTHPEKLGVYYGNEGSPEAMTNRIVEYAPFARSAYEESISIIHFDQPQTIYIGFYAFSDKDENWLCVDDVSLEKIESDDIDLGITGIVYPEEYVRNGSSKSISFHVRNFGITDTSCTCKVKINETVIVEQEVTIAAQDIVNYNIVDQLASLAEGTYTLSVELVNSEDQAQANNVMTTEFKVLGTPMKLWNFEEGTLPADFTFRSEDEGTVNPSAGSEFNEYGWGIFNIQEHAEFGEHMLAGTSWLDGTDKADRWCILPPYMADESSLLIWDAASFNPNFLESYSIMVSSNGDDPWYYFSEESFYYESADFKTRGVDLSLYAGKEIYIAFRLHSKNCEHLIIDNIALYGGNVTSGIEDVVGSEAAEIRISNETITVNGAEVKEMVIYNVSGATIATTTSEQLSINSLAPAIYMVRVTTANGEVLTKKFSKK